jgi:hypothetical protein
MGMSAPKAPLQLRRLDSVPPGSLGAFSRLDQEQDRGCAGHAMGDGLGPMTKKPVGPSTSTASV